MTTKATTAPKEPKNKAKDGGLGLGNLSGLLSAPEPAESSSGPIELLIDLIDEDPNQPRTADNPGFSDASIAEIGATIKARGVKSPISVRENPDAPGRYLINHGARRYRGSKWAAKMTVPAFIDNDYNEADQVIENLQRNELTAREIADFIGRELAKNKKKGEIAKEIGKSASFVSQHVALLDLPDVIAEAFNSGRVKDVTLVNELVTAHKKSPDEVVQWLEDDSQEVTRGSVKLLREYLEEKNNPNGGDGQADGSSADGEEGEDPSNEDEQPEKKKEKPEADPTKLKKAIVQVEHNGRPARLLLNIRPTTAGYAWFKYDDDGEEFETDLANVKLIQLLEG